MALCLSNVWLCCQANRYDDVAHQQGYWTYLYRWLVVLEGGPDVISGLAGVVGNLSHVAVVLLSPAIFTVSMRDGAKDAKLYIPMAYV